MTFTVIEKIGDGGYGDVYKGHDGNLNRDVAIKFIRTDAGDREFARQQAIALARCNSPYVVTVFGFEEVADPANGESVPALIMELVPGRTLLKELAEAEICLDEARRIGFALIDGLEAIHAVGVVHGDFNPDNVMITKQTVKIIDILYHGTLAGGTPDVRDSRRQLDYSDLRQLLAKIIRAVSPTEADAFIKNIEAGAGINQIRDAFDRATDTRLMLDVAEQVKLGLRRLNDPAFVDTDEYAQALADETPDQIIRPLLDAIVSGGDPVKGRRRYLALLWNRLSLADRRRVGTSLAEAIEREVPNGKFGSLMGILVAFGRTGWGSLGKRAQLRLENAIVESLGKGQYDYYASGTRFGSLGTWVTNFYHLLSSTAPVLDHIVSLLHGGWNSQNYVGHHFMGFLPRIVKSPEDRARLIEAIADAVHSNAFRVKANLKLLPAGWQTDVDAEVAKKNPPPTEGQS